MESVVVKSKGKPYVLDDLDIRERLNVYGSGGSLPRGYRI